MACLQTLRLLLIALAFVQDALANYQDYLSTDDDFINEDLGEDYISVPEKLQDGKLLKPKFKPMKKCCYMRCCYPICCCPMSYNKYDKNRNFLCNHKCNYCCPSCNMCSSRGKLFYCCNALQCNRCCLPMCCCCILPCCCYQRSSHKSSNGRIKEIESAQLAALNPDPNPQPSYKPSKIITAKEEVKTAKEEVKTAKEEVKTTNPTRNVRIMDEESSLNELIRKLKNQNFKIPLSNLKSRNTITIYDKK